MLFLFKVAKTINLIGFAQTLLKIPTGPAGFEPTQADLESNILPIRSKTLSHKNMFFINFIILFMSPNSKQQKSMRSNICFNVITIKINLMTPTNQYNFLTRLIERQ
jgi:hypothetical protein